MEILEAYDLTRCAHSAARLVGCDEKTVTRYVAVRDAGRDVGEWERRSRMIDPFLSKIEELVDASQGRIRADVVHEKLTAMGFRALTARSQVPLHYHTGIAEVYTLSGRWHYLEYPDQPQTAGFVPLRASASVHPFICPETNTEETVIFIRVVGTNVNFTEDGAFHSMLDAR